MKTTEGKGIKRSIVWKEYFVNRPIESWMVCPVCGRARIHYQGYENGQPLIINSREDSVFVGCDMLTADKEIHGRYISMTDFAKLIVNPPFNHPTHH